MKVYLFIAAEKPAERNVIRSCALLSVSRSAYYDWSKQTPSARARSDEKLRSQVNGLNQAQAIAEHDLKLRFFEGAISLYEDDYLISDPYADWLQTERERLRERFFNALLQAAERYAETGRYADAITTCRRMLARDEVRENAYQALMRYQAESGDSAGALLASLPTLLLFLFFQRFLVGGLVAGSVKG